MEEFEVCDKWVSDVFKADLLDDFIDEIASDQEGLRRILVYFFEKIGVSFQSFYVEVCELEKGIDDEGKVELDLTAVVPGIFVYLALQNEYSHIFF